MTNVPTRTDGSGPAETRLGSVGPGLLVAATGVGAGDLATAAFTGDRLGVAVLWAVVVGAGFKYVVNEGLARWQLATGETLLEGALTRLGGWVRWVFGAYFVLWCLFVGSALVSACGVALHAIFPVFADPVDGKLVFGVLASLAGLTLVWRGGFVVFERVMAGCIGLMFATVVTSAVLVCEDWGAVARGLAVPSIPDADAGGIGWTVALMGSVGGTLTVLCYGYWIREKGRRDASALSTCRADLAAGYAMTALFGVAMVVLGSTVHVEGHGANLVVQLGDRLGETLGAAGRWAFLAGAFGAVFSSLLGVWQSAPYLFADFWGIVRRPAGETRSPEIRVTSRAYRVWLVAMATVPLLGLSGGFREVQKLYALFGALFLPLLALALLVLGGRRDWIGAECRNGPLGTALLAAAVALFVALGWLEVSGG